MDIDKLTSLNKAYSSKKEENLKDAKAMKDTNFTGKVTFDSFYSEDFLTNYFKIAIPELKKKN